jgi:D-alanine-D-alanine ligase
VKKRLKVAVLMGGRSTEREVSLVTGKMVLEALDPVKYEALPVEAALLGRLPGSVPPALGEGLLPGGVFTPELLAAGTQALMAPEGDPARPDVVFIALHGRHGEDGTVQGFLELLNLPYTGSGVLASALAMNKVMSKKLFQAEAIPTPAGMTLAGPGNRSAFMEVWRAGKAAVGVPCVVKPNEQGSTIGISIVRRPEQMAAALELAFKYDDTVLIEQFVEGVEITAALLGNETPEVLPLVEIVPTGGFYDYERKYTPGATEEIVPARIPEALATQARAVSERCHRAFGCRGMSRVDMIVAPGGVWVLEVNTIPGMTPTSLLPRAAAAAGIPFPRLVDRLIELALKSPGDGKRAGQESGKFTEPTAEELPRVPAERVDGQGPQPGAGAEAGLARTPARSGDRSHSSLTPAGSLNADV